MELWQVPLSFSRLRMFPFFDLAHYVASVLALKEQRGVVEVSVRSPLACWFSAMLYCFGGSVLSSLMLGEPPVAFLAKTINILLASSVWYLVFYCPEDIVYRCFSFLPLRLLVAGMKEVTRTWKITDGIAHADIVYKDAWLIMVAVGWARGAGGGLISNFEQLVRGVWKPETNELLQMSYPVKVKMMLTRCATSPLAPFEAAMGQMFFGSQKTPSKVKGEGATSSNGSSVCDQPSEQHHEGAKKKQAKKTD